MAESATVQESQPKQAHTHTHQHLEPKGSVVCVTGTWTHFYTHAWTHIPARSHTHTQTNTHTHTHTDPADDPCDHWRQRWARGVISHGDLGHVKAGARGVGGAVGSQTEKG